MAEKISDQTIRSLDLIMAPSDSVAQALKKRIGTCQILTVGQPVLEYSPPASEALSKKLHLEKDRDVIYYAGGYGEDYADSFRLFAQAAARNTEDEILIGLHPKTTGELERKILLEEDARRARILPKSITVPEALSVAKVAVSHRSTVGIQAVFAGRQAIYLDTQPQKYSDIAIEKRWAQQVSSVHEAERAIREPLCLKGEALFEEAGIPKNAAENMVEEIKRQLETAFATPSPQSGQVSTRYN